MTFVTSELTNRNASQLRHFCRVHGRKTKDRDRSCQSVSSRILIGRISRGIIFQGSSLHSNNEVVQNGISIKTTSEIFQVSKVEMVDGCERSRDKET